MSLSDRSRSSPGLPEYAPRQTCAEQDPRPGPGPSYHPSREPAHPFSRSAATSFFAHRPEPGPNAAPQPSTAPAGSTAFHYSRPSISCSALSVSFRSNTPSETAMSESSASSSFFPSRSFPISPSVARVVPDPYVPARTPYIPVPLTGKNSALFLGDGSGGGHGGGPGGPAGGNGPAGIPPPLPPPRILPNFCGSVSPRSAPPSASISAVLSPEQATSSDGQANSALSTPGLSPTSTVVPRLARPAAGPPAPPDNRRHSEPDADTHPEGIPRLASRVLPLPGTESTNVFPSVQLPPIATAAGSGPGQPFLSASATAGPTSAPGRQPRRLSGIKRPAEGPLEGADYRFHDRIPSTSTESSWSRRSGPLRPPHGSISSSPSQRTGSWPSLRNLSFASSTGTSYCAPDGHACSDNPSPMADGKGSVGAAGAGGEASQVGQSGQVSYLNSFKSGPSSAGGPGPTSHPNYSVGQAMTGSYSGHLYPASLPASLSSNQTITNSYPSQPTYLAGSGSGSGPSSSSGSGPASSGLGGSNSGQAPPLPHPHASYSYPSQGSSSRSQHHHHHHHHLQQQDQCGPILLAGQAVDQAGPQPSGSAGPRPVSGPQPPLAGAGQGEIRAEAASSRVSFTTATIPGYPSSRIVFICECCPKKPKRFESYEDVEAHTNEKQYQCQFCSNRFKNKNEAERHQNSLHLRHYSWSCASLYDVRAVFHASPGKSDLDMCGYCGQEFGRPAEWAERSEHVNLMHKFGECNQSKKFYRADHFRQHLKHSHSGTSGKWTNLLENACMRVEGQGPGQSQGPGPGQGQGQSLSQSQSQSQSQNQGPAPPKRNSNWAGTGSGGPPPPHSYGRPDLSRQPSMAAYPPHHHHQPHGPHGPMGSNGAVPGEYGEPGEHPFPGGHYGARMAGQPAMAHPGHPHHPQEHLGGPAAPVVGHPAHPGPAGPAERVGRVYDGSDLGRGFRL